MNSSLEELQQSCISPRDRDPKTYLKYQNAFNDAYLSRARSIIETHDMVDSVQSVISFSSNSKSKPRVSLLTTGSDGRGEKALASPIEIVVLTDESLKADQSKAVRKVVCDILQQYNKDLDVKLFDSSVEVKSTVSKRLTYFTGDWETPMPARLMDAKYICGDCDLLVEAKALMLQEINEKGRDLLESVRDRLRAAKKIVPTGKQDIKLQGKARQIEHYNITDGKAWYEPENYITSFKQGPLRLIHYRTAVEFIKAIRKVGNDDIGRRWLQDSPLSIVDRWYFLQAEGAIPLPFNKVNDLVELYSEFLWHYSFSEFAFVREDNPEISFDSKTVSEQIKKLINLDEYIVNISK